MIIYVITAIGSELVGKTNQSVEAPPAAIQQSVEQVRKNIELLKESMSACSDVLYRVEQHTAGHVLKRVTVDETVINETYKRDSLDSMAKYLETVVGA
jgi:hypothetical protein